MYLLLFVCSIFLYQSFAQTITTVAGCGTCMALGDGGQATAAAIGYFGGIACDTNGNIFIADGNNQRVRKVSVATGIITTVGGTGTLGSIGDGGPATLAQLNQPIWIAFDQSGDMYVTDGNNDKIRKIDYAGIITTYAGNGVATFSGDGGSATDASLDNPQGICFDKFGNLYVADNGNQRIRKISPLGVINTLAGIGVIGSAGDGGPATAAELNSIYGVATDTSGNVYVADQGANKIRKVDISTGIISTVAGDGTYSFGGDGMHATNAQLKWPRGIAIDAAGSIYIADQVNNRIRLVDHATGIISTIAGSGITGSSGDGGIPLAAALNRPCGVALDACGNVYIADKDNKKVRKVTFNPPVTPTITVTSITTATLGATVTVNAIVSGAGSSYTIKWFKNAILFSTTTVPTATYTKGVGTDVITARLVPTMLTCYDSATSAGHTITQQTVGLSSVQLGEFQIYPNPVGNIIAITGTEPINCLLITDIMSRAVATLPEASTKKHELQWHIGNLPKGVYFIKVNDWYVQRFLKE